MTQTHIDTNTQKNAGNGGFTLVEMAVVVTIIGLLAVGVAAGKNLLEGGKTRAIIGEIDDHSQSMLQFQEKYFDWPGDITDASTLWAGTPNGNGDEQITWATEGAIAWRHLELANMTSQTGFSNVVTADAVVGTIVPASKTPGAGWFMDYSTELKNHIGLGAQKASGVNDDPVIAPKRAYNIDVKLDDGYPTTGLVRSSGGSCYTGTYYNTENSSPTCTLRVSVQN